MVKVELSLHAKNLKNVAGAFKGTSDPFAVVTKIATKAGESPEVLGKTEIIKNSLNPDWSKVFVFDYELGTPTKVAVTMYDEVRKGDNKSMGAAVFDIGELLAARGQTKATKVKGGGKLFAQIRKSQGSGVLQLQMKGIKLTNTEGFLRKSDPFFELSRKVDAAGGQTWDNVFKSNTVKDNLSPVWDEVTLENSVLCGGDLDLPIMVKVFDHESSGDHVLMGQFETSVNGIVKAGKTGTNIRMTKKGKDTGTIVVEKAILRGTQSSGDDAEIEDKVQAMSIGSSKPSFVDYISGGTQLNVTVAIDFTGSNGDPRKPGTLHYLNTDGGLNDYEKAISSIVGILSKYDSDKKFPVLGFGAKYDGVINHCFKAGGLDEHEGVSGVLSAYRDVFKSGLVMSSPTDINQVIRHAAERAETSLENAMETGNQTYTILLIVSDGCVSDIPSTAKCLREVEDAPMSVVIVGVGNANFSGMRFIDDLRSPGKRDIVQFVSFNEHGGDPVQLSSATLQEIPDQLVGYFQKHGIDPNSAVSMKEGDIVVEEEQEIDLSLDFAEEGDIVVSAGGRGFSDW